MPIEFPDDFTAFPGTPAATDYVMLNKYKAQLGDLASVFNASTTLVEWNNSSVAQFTASGDIGTPTTPTLTYLAQPTVAVNAIRQTLANGTGAGEGRVNWFGASVTYQSMRVRFTVAIDAANPIQPGETMGGGVIIGGSVTTGNGIAIGVTVDSAGQGTLGVSIASAYNTLDASILTATLTGASYGAYSWDVDVTFAGSLKDSGTYAPNGAPTLAGPISVVGSTGVFPYSTLISIATTSWNVAVGALDTSRVGIYCATPTGVTATTGILLGNIRIETAS
jgi:hypothetical protein